VLAQDNEIFTPSISSRPLLVTRPTAPNCAAVAGTMNSSKNPKAAFDEVRRS